MKYGRWKLLSTIWKAWKTVKRLLSDEMIVEKEYKFKTWKTIKLGTRFKTADDFCSALRNGKFRVSNQTSNILKSIIFKTANKKIKIDLVKIMVSELGFEDGAKLNQIYEKAQKFGLFLCPPEVGPQLRLQYKNQPNGEWIFIAMEPIFDSDGYPNIFVVGCFDSGLKLYNRWSDPDDIWPADTQWVFCRSCN